jgi:hypothetical protein
MHVGFRSVGRWWRCCGLLAACIPVLVAAQRDAAPETTYEALTSLPDWSGWWGLPMPFQPELLRNPPPMRSEDFARLESGRTGGDDDPDSNRFCRPNQFVGYSGGFVENIEFLFTPGRVTITNEMGLIRRIYTDGRPLPQDVDDSNTGTSVGRWEGQTLVIETVGINPEALYPGAVPAAIPIGRNVRITERISLTDADTLEFEVVTVAPDILTAPDRRTRIYTRVPKQVAREITFCTDSDRSIDPVTGRQRFDMTPPADLPPPPER